MKQCPACLLYWDNVLTRCPSCTELLPSNEASSEDADEGVFVKPAPEVKWWTLGYMLYVQVGDEFYLCTNGMTLIEANGDSGFYKDHIVIGAMLPHTPTQEQQSALEKWMRENK